MVMDTLEGKPSPFSRLKSLKFIDSVNPLKIPAKVLNYLLSGSPCVETMLTEFRNDELCVTSPSNSGFSLAWETKQQKQKISRPEVEFSIKQWKKLQLLLQLILQHNQEDYI